MFQGDGVTISRVYPSVLYLKKLLSMTTYTNSSKIITPISFVTEFMTKCLKFLNLRFSTLLLNEDVILVSTFLDTRLGIFSFEDDKKDMV